MDMDVVIVEPNRGHEYVDNRMVADALDQIPLDGTLSATNDLRYPADDFRRSNRQFQLAAAGSVFGSSEPGVEPELSCALSGPNAWRCWRRPTSAHGRTVWPGCFEIAQLRDNVGLHARADTVTSPHYPHSQDIPLRISAIPENRDQMRYVPVLN